MKQRHRDKTRIMYEILRYLSKKDFSTKDEIVRKTNTTYSSLVKYIYELQESGAIQTTHTKRTTAYKITEKGKQLLEKMRTIYEMLGEET